MKIRARGLLVVLVAFFAIIVSFVALDWLKWDLFCAMNTFSGISGIVMLAMYCLLLFGIIVVWTLMYKHSRYRLIKTVSSCILCITIFIGYMLFMGSGLYSQINYNWQKNMRLEIIEMFESGSMKSYQTSVDRYTTPYRLASQNKYIYTTSNGNENQVEFVSYRGLVTIYEIVYTANDQPPTSPSYWTFVNIKKLDPNWYSVQINIATGASN